MACSYLMQFIRNKRTAETLKHGFEPEPPVALFCNKRFYEAPCISRFAMMAVETNATELRFLLSQLAYSLFGP